MDTQNFFQEYQAHLFDQQYASALRQKARKRSAEIFSNGKPKHAAIVMENIFRETNRDNGKVFIYGKSLNGEISGFENYRNELLAFLVNLNTQIQIIVDEVPEEAETLSNAFGMLKVFSQTAEAGPRIEMRKVNNPEGVSNLLNERLQLPNAHFAVSTSQMYRLEIDVRLHIAECSFNGPEQSQKLREVFQEIFDNYATPIA